MRRAPLLLLVLAFLLTRAVAGWLAHHPQQYVPSGIGDVTGDVILYESWADKLVDLDVPAYAGVGIEYPPGSLPFLAIPELLRPDGVPYRVALIVLMVALDAFGFAGLLAASRRLGSLLGPWLWVLAVPALGPIVYVRLDMVPAVATMWSVTSMSAGSWFSAGAWLGFGTLAKVYPGFLLPPAFFAARDRKAFTLGTAVLLLTPLLPFVASLDDLYRSVGRYHLERGVQLESIWANGLLIASRLGYVISVEYSYGALHVESGVSDVLKTLATLLSLVALAAGTWLAWRVVPREPTGRAVALLAAVLFTTLTLIQAVGSVFSAQFVLWLIALGAAAGCARECPIRGPILLLLPAAALTQVLFPFVYAYLAPLWTNALAVETARNALVLLAGLWAFVTLARLPRPSAADAPAPAAAEVAA